MMLKKCVISSRAGASRVPNDGIQDRLCLLLCVMPKSTPEQTFAKFFNLANDEAAPANERAEAERKMAAWLKRHGKTRRDLQAILVKAAQDEAAANPPPPPPDPRAGTPHSFGDSPVFTPAGVVEGLIAKYVTMQEPA